MPGLTIIVVDADPTRARAATVIAAASAALDVATRLHLDAAAAPLLRDPAIVADLNRLAEDGVRLSICPTGIGDHAIAPDRLPPLAERFGMVALLASMPPDDRLVAV